MKKYALMAPEDGEGGSLGGGDGGAEFDMDGAVDTLSAELFGAGGEEGTDDEDLALAEEAPAPQAKADAAATEETPAPQAKGAPQSWKKEMHEKYAALPPDVQAYINEREEQMRAGLDKDRGDANLGRTMRDVMTPYRELLQQQGVDEPRAVQYLLNAHYKLTTDPVNTFIKMAEQYGVDLAQVAQGAPAQAEVDPAIKALQQELAGVKNHLSASQQAAVREAKERVTRDVNAFASDPAHPYFDEVADDLVVYLQAGHELDAAYEKAVWANPVTRQKEVARLQQEQEANFRAQARAEAEAARKAASNTVRNRDTRRAPTEPQGSMRDLDSSLRDSLREIKQRTGH